MNKIRAFDGASAIVTGAASGIGLALAAELASRGCRVVLADRQVDLARKGLERIIFDGGDAVAEELDVTDAAAVDALVNRVASERGRLDYMFNNAGVAVLAEAKDYSGEDWKNVIDTNIYGVINGVRSAYKVMVKQGFGHIVNTASMAGFMITPYLASYAASKYAVVGLSKTLRVEAEPLGVRVSVICPGVIRTPILEGGRYGKIKLKIPGDMWESLKKKLHPMAPEKFARKAISAVAKNKAIIIIPSRWRIFRALNNFAPGLEQFLVRRAYRRMQKAIGHK